MTHRRTVLLAGATSGLSALGLVVPAVARAQDAPPELLAELPSAQWVGAARMRYFTFNVYDASLWVAPGFSAGRYAQSAFGLQLSYLRSLDGKAIAQRSIAEMRRGASLTPAQEERWLAAMQTAFPDVKAGDRITGLHQPGVGARFWFNGIARSAVADAEFSRLFFGIWLAESTSEPSLRTALLAKAAS
nr:chalcone isomerase family protein [uncultured Rhodoferax sp.]